MTDTLLSRFIGEFLVELSIYEDQKSIFGKMINTFILDKKYIHSIFIINGQDCKHSPRTSVGYLSKNNQTGLYENTWVGEMNSETGMSFYTGDVEGKDLMLYRYDEKNKKNYIARNHVVFKDTDNFFCKVLHNDLDKEVLFLEGYFTRISN